MRQPRRGRGPGGTEPREGEMSGPDRGTQVQGAGRVAVCRCRARYPERPWGPGRAERRGA